MNYDTKRLDEAAAKIAAYVEYQEDETNADSEPAFLFADYCTVELRDAIADLRTLMAENERLNAENDAEVATNLTPIDIGLVPTDTGTEATDEPAGRGR